MICDIDIVEYCRVDLQDQFEMKALEQQLSKRWKGWTQEAVMPWTSTFILVTRLLSRNTTISGLCLFRNWAWRIVKFLFVNFIISWSQTHPGASLRGSRGQHNVQWWNLFSVACSYHYAALPVRISTSPNLKKGSHGLGYMWKRESYRITLWLRCSPPLSFSLIQ